MRILKSFIILIGILLLFSTNSMGEGIIPGMPVEDNIVDGIIQLIKENPDQWIDTGRNLLYVKSKKKFKEVNNMIYPRFEADIVILYDSYHGFHFIILEKPFSYEVERELLKKLIVEIKLLKLKKLTKEVGHLLDKPEETLVPPKVKKEKVKKTKNGYNPL